MEFVETKVFSKRVADLGLESQLRDLQSELLRNPEAGVVEPGTGGLRKVRVPDPTRGKGKKGGARIHYLLLAHRQRIYLLYAYAKDQSEQLTPDQKKQLRDVVDSIKNE